ncbi:MAG TPA: type II toxin-antitoxin system RelE/ParE family toxin [Dissulfurispiraceae bacterium]|nr:type II toxin-antitoxin system RelE/ParE family toxin [Dissulfurispiraceae bacterium]
MKKYAVRGTLEAKADLLALCRYVAANDSKAKANHLLDNIEKAMAALENMPLRGACPPELERVGVFEYREVFYKPYRIIYQVVGRDVFVLCILDGRRRLTDLLQERLLRPD